MNNYWKRICLLIAIFFCIAGNCAATEITIRRGPGYKYVYDKDSDPLGLRAICRIEESSWNSETLPYNFSVYDKIDDHKIVEIQIIQCFFDSKEKKIVIPSSIKKIKAQNTHFHTIEYLGDIDSWGKIEFSVLQFNRQPDYFLGTENFLINGEPIRQLEVSREEMQSWNTGAFAGIPLESLTINPDVTTIKENVFGKVNKVIRVSSSLYQITQQI